MSQRTPAVLRPPMDTSDRDRRRLSNRMTAVTAPTLVALAADAGCASSLSGGFTNLKPEGLSVAIVVGFAVVAGLAVLGLTVGVLAMRQRARMAVGDVRRLKPLFDLLAEGIAVCSGMQILAINTSLSRLIGMAAEDV